MLRMHGPFVPLYESEVDRRPVLWHLSGMSTAHPIPSFNLFGETTVFPDVVHCEQFFDRAAQHGWTITPHRHDQMAQLFVMGAGSAEVSVDGASQRLTSGHFLFLPPHVVHGFVFAKGSHGVVISFPTSVFLGLAGEGGQITNALSRPFLGATTEALGALTTVLARLFAERGGFRAQSLVSTAQAMLSLVAEHSPVDLSEGADDRLKRLDALIAQHMAEGWSARDYADALSVTTGHLSRLCRAATGQGASSYIETAIMAEARRLLAFTRLQVAEVGYRLGFSDPSYFSKRFKAKEGMTPVAYKARFAPEA